MSISSGGTLILGAGDGASQTAIKIRGSNATGSDVAGVDFTFDASNGTGCLLYTSPSPRD